MIRKNMLLSWVVGLLVTACGKTTTPAATCGTVCADGGETFSSIQNNILTKSCATTFCHDSVSAEAQMNLSSGSAYARLVSVDSVTTPCTGNAQTKRVQPGFPDTSCLLLRLTTTSPDAGERMPKFETPLCADQIDCVRKWIQNGAPNN